MNNNLPTNYMTNYNNWKSPGAYPPPVPPMTATNCYIRNEIPVPSSFYTTSSPSMPPSYFATPQQSDFYHYPTGDRSFSSGYASVNSSFGSSSSPIGSTPTRYANPHPHVDYHLSPTSGYTYHKSSYDQISDSDDETSCKRARLDASSYTAPKSLSTTEIILQQVFRSPDPLDHTKARTKKSYKKRATIQSSAPCVKAIDATSSRLSFADITNSFVNTVSACMLDDTHDSAAESDDSLDEQDTSLNNTTGGKKKRVLSRNQRVAANNRERKRMNIMNESFAQLRHALPISTGRKRRKMSRLDIVIGAMEYIDYLDALLAADTGDAPIHIDFEAYQNRLYDYFN